jgi:hypothetical protein
VAATAAQLAALGDDGAGAVAEYLAGLGYAGVVVTVRLAPTPALVVDADRDPTADLAAWAGDVSAARKALRQKAQACLAFAQAVENGQTPTAAQTQAALANLIRVVQWAIHSDNL